MHWANEWLLVYMTMNQLYIIDISSQISSLLVMNKGGRRITYPAIHCQVYGKHIDDVNFESVQYFIQKLQQF